MDDLLKVLCPLAPHFTEELWQQTGHKGSIVVTKFPVYDEKALHVSETEILVQFNSRPKVRLKVDSTLSPAEQEKAVLANPQVVEALNGAAVKKCIIIPGRLVNIIV